jgi:phage terminase large subunit-like protein
MLTDMTPDGPRARDPRFEFWNRMIVRAEVEDPVTHERRSCWPSMWPLTRAIQKSTPSLSGKISLEEIRERLGTAVYSKEYMAKPGESDTAHFPDLISDSSRARYGWTIDGVDQAFTTNPRSSGATIGWQRGTPEAPSRVEMPLAQFLRESYLFLTADTSDTANHDSDWKACACMAYLPTHNELFLLDVWGKVARETALVKAIFQMADRWKVPAIYPEKEKGSVGLITTLQSIVQTRATTQMGVTHLPVIRPIPPGTDSKVTRIDNALTMRFEHGLIKFPFWAQGPQWQALYDQIVGFNPNAEDGGLEHDDLLDCVAMHDKPVKGFRRVPTENTGGSTNAIELLLKGRTTINHVPIGMGMNWDLVSPEDVHRLLTPIPTPMSDPDEPYAGTRV